MPRTFLLCRAGGRACGLASGGVMEVMPAAPSAALPGVAAPALGLIPVICDSRRMLWALAEPAEAASRLAAVARVRRR